jgi:restriction system protein
MSKPLSKSNQLASQVMYAAMCTLRDAGGEMKGSDILELLPAKLSFDDWANEIIESNGLTRWRTYAHFFSVDATKSGFLTKLKGVWRISPQGIEALKAGEQGYFLQAQQGYRAWRKQQLAQAGAVQSEVTTNAAIEIEELVPPEVQFDKLRRELNATLAAEILERVKSNSWQFFERLVVDVLKSMGYGGAGHSSLAYQRGSDGGIDGFINQDKLGLDVIYLQAKRWTDQTVQRPDIQQFVGALAGRQASRGVFITTSRFSEGAREFVKSLSVRVILIDGEHLAQLMIDHDVGVTSWKSYELKRIDSDFFADE